MHKPRTIAFIAALAMTWISGCGNAQAPQGRWEGFSQSAEWLVAVRLQVDPGNTIHSTALSVNVEGISLPRRLELTRKIKQTLILQWPAAVVAKVDYRNKTLTKAGGVAPLFVFDPKSGAMTFHFYGGGKLTEKIKLYPVKVFADAG
jgi:hypothetical protein